MQDIRNKTSQTAVGVTRPSSFNKNILYFATIGVSTHPVLSTLFFYSTAYSILFFPCSFPKRKVTKSRFPVDSNHYIHLDDSKANLLQKDIYKLIELSDDVVGISPDYLPDRQLRHKTRLSFISDLSFNLPVGVFTYLFLCVSDGSGVGRKSSRILWSNC